MTTTDQFTPGYLQNNRPCSIRHLVILISLGLIIGFYLNATTVVISKDSVSYIKDAQRMQTHLSEVLAKRPALYEFLIFSSHRLFYSLFKDNSLQGWLLAGQGITLLCKLLAIIPIYLLGCIITTSSASFRGSLILLMLPEPAQLGSDILREWPNLLFMASSFLCILYGARKRHPWAFLFAGLFAGVSFLIRPESAQLIIFAIIILAALFIASKTSRMRLTIMAGALLLIIGTLAVVLVYAYHSGRLDNRYLEKYKTKAQAAAGQTLTIKQDTLSENKPENTIPDSSSPAFLYELFKDTGELLMWFFLPFWGVGLYYQLRYKADAVERFLVAALILTSIGSILFRYLYITQTVAGRWCLPFIALTISYIPAGIEQITQWITRKQALNATSFDKLTRIILAAGILICIPKLVRPLGQDKQEYLAVARWINENTESNAFFNCFDVRIPFYAERNYISRGAMQNLSPEQTLYVIAASKPQDADTALPAGAKLEKSFPANHGKREIRIYRCD